MNVPQVVYFPSGVLVYFPSGARTWLAGLRGKSVTELEILHGVLNNPDRLATIASARSVFDSGVGFVK